MTEAFINLDNSHDVVIDGFTTVTDSRAATRNPNNTTVCMQWNSKNVTIKNCHFTSNALNWRPIGIDGTNTTGIVFENNVVGPFPCDNVTAHWHVVTYGGTSNHDPTTTRSMVACTVDQWSSI